jgi:hypothetical protein
MPRLTFDRIPKYQKHRASGQAVVTLDGRDFYLGPHGTKASRAEYDRLVGEWQANGGRLPAADGTRGDLSINELIVTHWEYAARHHVKDGEPTSEQHGIKSAFRRLKRLDGHLPAREFGPLKLTAVRYTMIEEGLCRTAINHHVARIRRMFKWAGCERTTIARRRNGACNRQKRRLRAA